jgi:long-chain acyl-CoA synthetase
MKARNLADMLQEQADTQGDRIAIRYKRDGVWKDKTWRQYRDDAVACAAALIEKGIAEDDRVGVLAENSVEWLVCDMGILSAGAINVPLHSPLTARQIHFQLAETETCWVFVSGREQLDKIRQIQRELPALRGLVVFDATAAGPDVVAWADFLARGREALKRSPAVQAQRQASIGPDDLCTIVYTSGTTGNPKGAMLTHGNILSNIAASQEASPHAPDSVLLSWLPYSHIYARTVDHYLSIYAGTAVAVAESPETVVANLAEIQPTHLTAVPRFYEKVLAAVTSPDPAETGKRLRHIFGPRIEWLSAGGAPLSRPVGEAYTAAGLPMYQGYGLTESSPVITFNRKEANKLGTVGKVLPGVEVKINPDGEILTRGPHVMKGYWRNPQATAEAIRDGWLYTGDIGSVDPEGYLTITGRKKELLVLSNGKKIVPSFIEGLLVSDDYIDQAAVCGEGRAYITALIVPKWDNLCKTLKADGRDIDGQPREALCRHPAVKTLLKQRIDHALRDVSHPERVKSFVVLPDAFTVAADELTVSLKLRRNVVLGKHAAALETLYREGAESAEPAMTP